MQNNNDGIEPAVQLRAVIDSDLPVFFLHQLDEEANFMAAFTAKDPNDRTAFEAHWQKIRNKDDITLRTIIYDGAIAGNIAAFTMFGLPSISYWIGREYWGKGIATAALRAFLHTLDTRPLYARAAADNPGSIRVLTKCGFQFDNKEMGFANARGKEIEEHIYVLGS